MQARIHIIGKTYGRLTAMREAPCRRSSSRKPIRRVSAKCRCGKSLVLDLSSLLYGHTTSCGCAKIERARLLNRTHGMSHLLEFGVWKEMRQRCQNPNSKRWSDYGGRGIKVDERWEDFATFYRDMGPRPSPLHSIDRIDNEGYYTRNNCRWATPDVQRRNSRRIIAVSVAGKTMCFKDAAAANGVKWMTARMRVRRGWTPQDAVSIPIEQGKAV